MLSLPVELRLPIIQHIRDSIPTPLFEFDPEAAIDFCKYYNKILITLSLYHREWKAIAQSELFRNLYIRDARKMKLLLELLRRDGDFREYIKYSRSALLGERNRKWADAGGLQDYFDELVEYCPDLAEMNCYWMNLKLVEFQRFPKLRELNLSRSTILSAPATSHPNISAMEITSLSLAGSCYLVSPLDPAFLPFVRSLAVCLTRGASLARISPLLPQLTSLTILSVHPDPIARCVTLSTSLKILSLSLHTIGKLDLDSRAKIQANIEGLCIRFENMPGSDQQTAVCAIISGSRAMRKVILDGTKSRPHGKTLGTLTSILVPVCKKAKVELWKENCHGENGKVDLGSK